MAKISSVRGLLIVAALLAAQQTIGSHITKAATAKSPINALTIPIADLHMHDAFGMSRAEETGVMWGGLGSKRGSRNSWMATKESYGNRFIAWAGQAEFNRAYFSGGMTEMLNPNNPMLMKLYKDSEKDLSNGVIVGIGEIFINNQRSNRNPKLRRKGQVDAPIIRRFFDLVAKYEGFLAFHMDADSDSMTQLGNLLASNRKGRVVWNHCGSNSSASDVRSMMDKHPNLYCELSFRYPPVNKRESRNIFNADRIYSGWSQLMEDFSDRFMIGTDAHTEKEFVLAIETVRKGLLTNLTPETARKIAYQNAQRLFALKGAPGP